MIPRRYPQSLARSAAFTGRAALAALAVATCAPAERFDTSEPFTITAAGGTRPTTAIDPGDGTIYVTWVGTTGGTTDVYLSRLGPDDEHPTAPIRVNDLPGDAAPHDQAPPRVAVAPDGAVVVVWQNNRVIPGRRFPASDLRITRSTDRGQTFEPARTVHPNDDATPASHTFHDLAITDDGSVLVSWIESRDPEAADVTLAAGADASAATPTGPEVRLARSEDGGLSFPPSLLVDSGACPCCRTAISVAPDGSAILAWRKVIDGGIRDIVVAPITTARPGEGTTTGVPLAQTVAPIRPHADDWRIDACPHAGPAVLVDRAGTTHLAWYTGREGAAGLYYLAATGQGTGFSRPTPVLADVVIPPSQIALAADDDGRVWIAWEDRRIDRRRDGRGDSRNGGHDANRDPGYRVHLDDIARPATVESPAMLGGRPLTMHGSAPDLASAAGRTALVWLDGEAVRLVVVRRR